MDSEQLGELLIACETPTEYVQQLIDVFSDVGGGFRNNENAMFIIGAVTPLEQFGYITAEQFKVVEDMLEEYSAADPGFIMEEVVPPIIRKEE